VQRSRHAVEPAGARRRDEYHPVALHLFMPLKFKRRFIKAIDAHLAERYPMFKVSPRAGRRNLHPAYIRPPEQRSQDFELVNQDTSVT